MKSRIIARLIYYKGIAEERATNNLQGLTARLIHEAKVEAFEQAIAIVEEVMKNDE